MKDIDGSKTLAAGKWPKALTYMSGDIRNLETELLIAYDTLAHSIQQALNVTTNDHTDITIDSYHVETEAKISYSDDMEDGLPNMGAPFPLYNRETHHELTAAEEGHCKYKKCYIYNYES